MSIMRGGIVGAVIEEGDNMGKACSNWDTCHYFISE